MKNLLLLCLTISFATPVFGKADHKWLSKKAYQKKIAKAKVDAKRFVASDINLTDDEMSMDMKIFRGLLIGADKKNTPVFKKYLSAMKVTPCSDFKGIRTTKDLDNCLTFLDTQYEKLSPDLKFFAAQIIPTKAFRSFIYRVRPLFEKEKITHSMSVSAVYRIVSNLKVNFPTSQWNAGFNYVSEPFYADETLIKTSQDLQSFFASEVYPEYIKAAERLRDLDLSQNKIIWDNKLLYGTASFNDNIKRYFYIGEIERNALLSGIYMTLASIKSFNAYHLSGLFKLFKQTGKLYGFDGFFGVVDGVTSQDFVKSLHSKNPLKRYKTVFKKLFTQKPNGKELLEVSYYHYRESFRYQNITWTEIKDSDFNSSNLVNPRLFTSNIQFTNRQMKATDTILEGVEQLTSEITKESIKVDFKSFYIGTKDLKDLLPVSFYKMKIKSELKPLKSGNESKVVKFRDYQQGRPIEWNVKPYKILFPDLSNGKDVDDYLRIVNQSAGGLPVALILNTAIAY